MQLVAGRYHILDLIGAGGTSRVFRAEDRLTREIVALKQLHIGSHHFRVAEAGTHDSETLGLALEFRALAGLRHPNIVPVLDYGFDEARQPFLTMPLVAEAQPLTDAAQALDDAGKAALLLQVLSALLYLHRRDIIHRDIKPANVLVGSDGIARLLDFGLAVNNAVSLANDKGGLAGTIAYMAPELFHRPHATFQSDLYSLGLIAYEMFSGEYPYAANTAPMLMYTILHSIPDMTRVNTPVAPVIQRLIAKDVAERYETAQEAIRDLCALTGIPEPLESRTIQDSFLQASQFVGRQHELGLLIEALDQLMPAADSGLAARGSAWLVSGEAGVGKSRLLAELRVRALMRGARVLHGQALGEGGQTYQLWREPMRHLVLTTDLSPEDTAVLREIVPDIETITGQSAAALPQLDSQNHQRRLVGAIIAAFRKQTAPVVLFLEDLQWAVESLQPLFRLLDGLEALPLLVVGSLRREEGPDLPEQLSGMTLLRLDRLNANEIARLSESILGEVGRNPELLALLRRQTEGNALFIVEVLRTLADLSGGLNAVGRVALPDTLFAQGVVELVRRRLDRMPDWAMPLLQVAAAAGHQLDLNVLQAILTHEQERIGAAHFRLDQWLTVCSDAAVLEAADGVWQLSHEILRQVILSGLSDDERAALHRLIATTMERLYPDDASRAEALLEHWAQAGDLDRELPYLHRVVELQIDNPTGLDVARKLLQRTLDRLRDDDPRRSMLLVYMSQSYIRVDYRHGEMLARQALASALQHGDRPATARALHVLAAHVREQMRYAEAETYYGESLALTQALDDARGSAGNLVSIGIIHHDRLDYVEARRYYEAALAVNQQLGDEARIAFVEVLIGTLTRDQMRYDEAVPRIERGLALARRVGHVTVISQALNNLGVIYGELGDFERARHYLLESLTVNRDTGNQWGVANCHINLGFASLMLDDDEAARASLLEGIARANRISAVNLVLEGLVGIGWLFERAGDLMQGARLVGLAQPTANIDVRRRLVPLVAKLEAALPTDTYTSALREGAALTLADVVHDLLEHD